MEPLDEGHPNRNDDDPDNDLVKWNIVKRAWGRHEVRVSALFNLSSRSHTFFSVSRVSLDSLLSQSLFSDA